MFYSDDIIERVRQGNDIVDIIGSRVHLQKKGANYFGLCPFHNEKSPSFSVSPSKQMYYCFGCGKGGNVITFLMDYENDTFQEALSELAERAGIRLPERDENDQSRREGEYRRVLMEIHREAARFYYYQLTHEPGKNGLAYLKGRGLSDETIRNFGLGFSLPAADTLYRYLKQKGYDDRQLSDSGLVRIEERGVYDKFWNRVMFPIMDINNHVIGFGGRVMGDGTPKYLNSPETRIFDKSRNLYGLNIAKRTRENYLLICEGYMDVISLHQAGFTNAVAALGTAFTEQHGLLIRRYTRNVVLTFDSDGAGIRAALRAIPLVRQAGLNAKVLTMEPYKDPDEFIKNLGPEAYRERIDGAMNAFMFEAAQLRKEHDFGDPAERTVFIGEISRMLKQFKDELEQDSYIQAVSKEYGIDYTMLRNRVLSLPEAAAAPDRTPQVQQASGKKREKDAGIRSAERLLLTWLAENPKSYLQIADLIGAEDFSDGLYRRTAELLFDQILRDAVNPGEILNHFMEDPESHSEIARIFHTKLEEEATPEERQRAFRECVIRVRRSSLERRAAAAEDFGELQRLMKEQKELSSLKIDLGTLS